MKTKNKLDKSSIKSKKGILNLFNVSSVTKALNKIKASNYKTEDKKRLFFSIKKFTKNNKILNKKAKESHKEYLAKAKTEEKIIKRLKEKYEIKDKRTLKKLDREKMKEKRVNKKAFKDSFKAKKATFNSANYETYIIAKTRVNGKNKTSTITMPKKEFQKRENYSMGENMQFMSSMLAEQIKKYLNLSKLPDVELLDIQQVLFAD